LTYIDELRDVIRRLHDAEATHVESVPVKETFQGQTVWEGVVEVFSLKDHPTAHRYMRGRTILTSRQSSAPVTVLHIPPVISPLLAVRAAIVQEFKSREPEEA